MTQGFHAISKGLPKVKERELISIEMLPKYFCESTGNIPCLGWETYSWTMRWVSSLCFLQHPRKLLLGKKRLI